MARIKSHLKVIFYGVIFGMSAYGIIQLGIVLHRFLRS
jgi:hypothetical protein